MTHQNDLNLFYLLVLSIGMMILGIILGVPLGWSARAYLLNHGELFRTIDRKPIRTRLIDGKNEELTINSCRV